MSAQRLVVVGASLAGLRAVEAARRDGHAGPITLIGAEEHLPYDRPPLSKAILEPGQSTDGDPAPPDDPRYREEDEFRDELDIELMLGAPADGLDSDSRELTVAGHTIEYDALVIATGASARTLPNIDGITGVHTLRTLDDAHAIRTALHEGARTVIIGAGFIGSEVASSAHKHGLSVTIVEALTTPLSGAVGEQMGARLAGLHYEHGTDLRCGTTVTAIEGDEHTGHVQQVVLDDGTALPADLVVVGVGAAPTTDWLASSGLRLDNGIVCDATLAAGPRGVFAAGDVARWTNPLFDGELMRLEHWTSAGEQGARAARNALDPDAAQPYATVPYFWSDWYDNRIQFVGIADADEIDLVSDDSDEPQFLALYRRGDRLVGALALNQPAAIRAYRKHIKKRGGWDDALAFARERTART